MNYICILHDMNYTADLAKMQDFFLIKIATKITLHPYCLNSSIFILRQTALISAGTVRLSTPQSICQSIGSTP